MTDKRKPNQYIPLSAPRVTTFRSRPPLAMHAAVPVKGPSWPIAPRATSSDRHPEPKLNPTPKPSADVADAIDALPSEAERTAPSASIEANGTERSRRTRPPAGSSIRAATAAVLVDELTFCVEVGIAQQTARNWRCQGLGPKWIRISRRCIRYSRDDIAAWIAERRVASTSDEGGDDA